MRFLRISLRWLLILLTIVSLLLYYLKTRPVAVAEQFIRELQSATDLKPISNKYFGGEQVEGGVLGGKLKGCELEPRTWMDILECRQRFKVITTSVTNNPFQMEPPGPLLETTAYYNCYSTPFTTKFKNFYSSDKWLPRPRSRIDLDEVLRGSRH